MFPLLSFLFLVTTNSYISGSLAERSTEQSPCFDSNYDLYLNLTTRWCQNGHLTVLEHQVHLNIIVATEPNQTKCCMPLMEFSKTHKKQEVSIWTGGIQHLSVHRYFTVKHSELAGPKPDEQTLSRVGNVEREMDKMKARTLK